MTKKYLIFNHIPKCGGTSLSHMFFDACCRPDNFFYKKPIYISTITHKNLILDDRDRDKIDCAKAIFHPRTCLFIDHSRYMSLENIFNLNVSQCYRTISIRNPVDRILSYNNKGGGKESRSVLYSVEKLLKDDLSLTNMIKAHGYLLTNYAVKNDKPQTEKAEEAKYIYKNCYDFIFDLDNLDDDIKLFNKKNPFGLYLTNIHKNKTIEKKEYPLELVKKIENLIEPEMDLYYYIKQLKTQDYQR